MLVILILCLTTFTLGEWVKEMQNPGLFEGDIVLDADEKLGYASIKGGRWPNAVIPYVIDGSVSSGVRANIPNAIADYERQTCLRFKRRTTESAYILFSNGQGCSSPVGYRGGRVNRVSLAPGCKGKGVIMHEIGHSIGMYHEQSRPDRDNHVEILYQNIQPGMAYNFNKQPASNIDSLGTPYDYLSLMHYDKTAFGVRGRTTIRTKDPSFQDRIGRKNGFSEIDRKQVNLMYRCGGTVPTRQPPVTQYPPTCTDKPGKPCTGWVRKGYCKFVNIKQDCCRSCKGGTVPTRRPPVTQYPPTCTDKPGKPCTDWVRKGYCKYVNIKQDCCRSCKGGGVPTQQPTCFDVAGKPCASWLRSGYCKYSNIKRDCCKTCRGGTPTCTDKPGKPCNDWVNKGYCKYVNIKQDCCRSCKGRRRFF